MRAFIFQFRREQANREPDIRRGTTDPWVASRYRSLMNPGDIVFLWMAGDERSRGIYGWGRLTSHPYPEWSASRGKSGKQREPVAHVVDVKNEAVLHVPLLATRLQGEDALRAMLILRAPQATNFLLSVGEAGHLCTLLKESGEGAPALEGIEP